MATFSPAQPRRAKTRRSAGKAAASLEARRALWYVEPLSEARTTLAGFFNILPIRYADRAAALPWSGLCQEDAQRLSAPAGLCSAQRAGIGSLLERARW